MKSNRAEERDPSRVDTQPAIPEIDNHPGIIECSEDYERRDTANSLPPGQLVAPDVFLGLASQKLVEHELRIGEVAQFLSKLSNAFPDLHQAAMDDRRIEEKLLLTAVILEQSMTAIRALKSNAEQALSEASESHSDTPEALEVASQRAGRSIRGMIDETNRTISQLEALISDSEGLVEGQDVVPPMHPGAISLSRRPDDYFGKLVAPNQCAVADGARKLAKDCLDTIPVVVDRLAGHLVTEMKAYLEDLLEVEGLHVSIADSPHLLDNLLAHIQTLLQKYGKCLQSTFGLIVRMPLRTQHMISNQYQGEILAGLETEIKQRITLLESGELDQDGARELMELEGKLAAIEQLRRQKGEGEEAILRATERGRLYLGTARVPEFPEEVLPGTSEPKDEDGR